jgi:HK97 family phage major capsid protein
MERIKRLLEQRATLWEQAKTINDRADDENRDLSAEEQEQWDRLAGAEGEINRLDKRIAELKALEDRNTAADAMRAEFQPEAGTLRGDGQPADPDTRDAAELRKLFAGEVKSVEFKRNTAEKRVLSGLSAGAGGNVIPTGFVNRLWEHMIDVSAIRRAGATVLTTESGEDIQVPKTTSHSTAGIIAEAGTISASDPAFGQITLGAYKYAFLTQLSTELLTDSGVDLLGYLSRQGGRALGNGSGAHFVTGTGTGQPNGVVTASVLGVTGGAGVAGAFTADELIDLYFSVIQAYRANGKWLMSDTALAAARKLKDTTDQYLWQPGLAVDVPDMLLGKEVVSDPNVAVPALSAKSVLFGDFSAYAIRDVNGVRIERSDDFAFDADLATIRFILRTDGNLIDQTGAVKHFIGNAA